MKISYSIIDDKYQPIGKSGQINKQEDYNVSDIKKKINNDSNIPLDALINLYAQKEDIFLTYYQDYSYNDYISNSKIYAMLSGTFCNILNLSYENDFLKSNYDFLFSQNVNNERKIRELNIQNKINEDKIYKLSTQNQSNEQKIYELSTQNQSNEQKINYLNDQNEELIKKIQKEEKLRKKEKEKFDKFKKEFEEEKIKIEKII